MHLTDLKDRVRPRRLRVGVCGMLRPVRVALLQEGEEAVGVGRPVHGQAGDGHALHAVLAERQLLPWETFQISRLDGRIGDLALQGDVVVVCLGLYGHTMHSRSTSI